MLMSRLTEINARINLGIGPWLLALTSQNRESWEVNRGVYRAVIRDVALGRVW